ncbi:DUF7266 family protein [Haloarchaeobius sp. DFWS5]|uniref:DUF7266 family protein n=1 Tax=Haloarchaeobius sp. DFWS5 TaxID=3446114 RepID=UPI003EBBBC13
MRPDHICRGGHIARGGRVGRGVSDDRNDREERGLSPVVGKVLEASVVLLYLGMLTTTMYGGVVPDYRGDAGDELADRTLAATTQQVEAAVPPNATRVAVRHAVDLPRTLRGEPYRIRVDGRRLVLDHPDKHVTSDAVLALPAHVVRVEGEWASNEQAVVVVERTTDGVVVRLAGDDGSEASEDSAAGGDPEAVTGAVDASAGDGASLATGGVSR